MPSYPGSIPRDPATVVSGLRNQNTTLSNRIIVDMSDTIHRVLPEAAPLTTMTSAFKNKRKVTQPQFDFLEKDKYPRILTVNGAVVGASATINVATGQGTSVAAGYMLRNTRTGEQVRVTSVATDALTVGRGKGSQVLDMADGDTLIFTRSVSEDGADIGVLKSVKETRDYNYTEIIRRPYGWTRRQAQTAMYGGKDTATERRSQAIEHEIDKELTAYFGRRYSEVGSGGNLITYTGGLEDKVTSNRWNLNGIEPTERAWIEFLEEALRWGDGGYLGGGKAKASGAGSATKYGFFSSRWMTFFASWGLEKLRFTTSDKSLGMDFVKYQSPHGVVMLTKSPVLDMFAPDMGIIVDLNHFAYAYFTDTILLKDRELPGVDGMEEEYLSDIGWEITIQESHSILTGIPV
jgi:hypothetical protein